MISIEDCIEQAEARGFVLNGLRRHTLQPKTYIAAFRADSQDCTVRLGDGRVVEGLFTTHCATGFTPQEAVANALGLTLTEEGLIEHQPQKVKVAFESPKRRQPSAPIDLKFLGLV